MLVTTDTLGFRRESTLSTASFFPPSAAAISTTQKSWEGRTDSSVSAIVGRRLLLKSVFITLYRRANRQAITSFVVVFAVLPVIAMNVTRRRNSARYILAAGTVNIRLNATRRAKRVPFRPLRPQNFPINAPARNDIAKKVSRHYPTAR